MPGRVSPERDFKNTFGPKLEELRLAKGITATHIIRKLQLRGWAVSNYTYSQLEAGRRILGDTELLMILAALNLRLQDLEESAAESSALQPSPRRTQRKSA